MSELKHSFPPSWTKKIYHAKDLKHTDNLWYIWNPALIFVIFICKINEGNKREIESFAFVNEVTPHGIVRPILGTSVTSGHQHAQHSMCYHVIVIALLKMFYHQITSVQFGNKIWGPLFGNGWGTVELSNKHTRINNYIPTKYTYITCLPDKMDYWLFSSYFKWLAQTMQTIIIVIS